MIRFSCSWSHLGSRWMSSWGTVTVGAWRAENIHLNTCWIWGKFSINRRSLSTLLLSLSSPPFTGEGAYRLETTLYQLFLRMRAEVSLFGRQGPKYFIWPIRIRAEERNQSDLQVISSNRPQRRENARDYVLCVCLFLFTFTRRWNEMKWNEMKWNARNHYWLPTFFP